MSKTQVTAYKIMKVFDYFDMPLNVRTKFIDSVEGKSNDTYVSYYPCDGCYKSKEKFKDWSKAIDIQPNNYAYEPGDDILSDWLLKNGANPVEEVLISH